ncbi:PREDICTED: uncharacterized protein LOC106918689 isoform X1 [Poecilia mexicana]|nr:PREDICTED: uncharacterized protein LOC106918689 isoform X1 [Poecilia mexicana]
MLTPKPIAELQKQYEPKEVTRHFDAFPSELDASSIKSRLRSRLTDYNLGSNYTHTSECTTFDQSFQKTDCSKRTKLAKPSLSADSQISLNSDKSETRRRQFNLDTETRVKPEALNSKSSQNQRSAPNQALRHSTQMDVKTAVSRSERASQDFSCQSSDFGQIPPMSGSAQRLNQVKTHIEAPQSLGILQSASDEPLYSQDGTFSHPDIQAKHPWNQEMTKQCENRREMNFSHTVLNQSGVCKTPDHNVGPEYPRAPCKAGRPFNRNRSGQISRRVSEWPQQIVYQPSAETQACQQKHQAKYSGPDRAFITEDSEDPYYVTMYYPDSVYVDMSDIVPPEVRPKPAVPAKPPNVGAPSPSSPFPPQGPGVGAGGIVAAPPSAIPVPIGSHGPSHPVGHSVGHSVGHNVGHSGGHAGGHAGGLAGGHAPAHSAGHGHGGSHSSGGGSTLLGYIGIDTIIEQMRKKTMKTGFDFNIMVVGPSGLGKSTLVNTLFKSQVSRKSAGWSRDEKIPKTVEIKSVSHVIEEGGVKMKLTVVDTPGFGDQINNDNCWEPISKYINEQFEKFLKEEVNITRKKRIPDTRVHCCLYFIPPTGHSLRQLDVEFMKRLSHSVNIIPVIAKSDTMTVEERQEFKQRVRKELEMNGIEFYPQKEFDDDIEDKSDNDKIREMMPFAVVGSDKEYQVNGKRVLGRKTPWGIIEVENPNHCEFAQLRDFLIRSHLQDLKEVTHNIHYETYRAKRLNDNGGLHPITSNDTQESNL